MDHSGSNNPTAPLEALEAPYRVLLISLYSFTSLLALVSNLLTILVLIKGKRCTRDLRKFLINLSVSDVLMAVFTIPFTYTNYMMGRWIFFGFMCPIVNFFQLTTITVSIYTLVAIAIDRYFAIMHPLQKSISWFKQHRTCIVVLVWSFGTAIGCSQLVVSETSTFEHSNQTYLSCGERWEPGSLYGKLYTLFIFSSTFALPMAILSVVYSAMGWRLLRYRVPGDHAKPHYDPLLNANATRRGLAQKSRPTVTTTPLPITVPSKQQHKTLENGNLVESVNDNNNTRLELCTEADHQNGDLPQSSSLINSPDCLGHSENQSNVSSIHDRRSWKVICIRRNKVVKMLITIIGVFTMCWLPIQIFQMWIFFNPNFLIIDSSFKYYSFVATYFFCHWISMAHSFMNPIIYSFMSKNFKEDMKTIFSNLWFSWVLGKDFRTSYSSANMGVNSSYYQQYFRAQQLRQRAQNEQQRFSEPFESSSQTRSSPKLEHPSSLMTNNIHPCEANHGQF